MTQITTSCSNCAVADALYSKSTKPARPSLFRKLTSTLAAVGGLTVILGLVFSGVPAVIAVCEKIKWCRVMISDNEPTSPPAPPVVNPQVVIVGNGCRPLGISGRLIVCLRAPANKAPAQTETPKVETAQRPTQNATNPVRGAAPVPKQPPVTRHACLDMKPFNVSDPHPCNSAIEREMQAQREANAR